MLLWNYQICMASYNQRDKWLGWNGVANQNGFARLILLDCSDLSLLAL